MCILSSSIGCDYFLQLHFINDKERREMSKNILRFGIIIYLTIMGVANGSVTPRDSIPERAIEIHSKVYVCEEWEAEPPIDKVATLLGKDATANWLDISQWITPVHLAQGFVDIIVTAGIGQIQGIEKPGWYMRGDADDQGEQDIRALCSGVFYDLIDLDFKTTTGNVFEQSAEDSQYVILRFGLPPVIGNYYKIYIGKGSVGLASTFSEYTDSCQVKFYLWPLDAGLYACPDLSDVAISYEVLTPVRRVLVNTLITFDCSRSISMDFDTLWVDTTIELIDTTFSSENITLYELDTDNNFNPGVDVTSDKPFLSYIYRTSGLKKVVLTVRDDSNNASRSNGNPRVTISSNPLPLWVEVIDSISNLPDYTSNVSKLYQCAPQPYIPSECPVTNIKYMITSPSYLTIKVYTFSGDLVKTLVDEPKSAGEWITTWDGRNKHGQEVGAGIYFCVMESGNFRKIERMVMIR